MKIEHIAIWVTDLEKMKDFYVKYFKATANTLYHNQKKEFKSYFLTFDDGARVELMQKPTVKEKKSGEGEAFLGFVHIAFSVGSNEAVDKLTNWLRDDGFAIASEPRTTGDGYYESCILDPESNQIEITV